MDDGSTTHARLEHFLGCLDVPAVGSFINHPVYTEAVGEGMGVADMVDNPVAVRETESFNELIDWIEAQPRTERRRSARRAPRAALHHTTTQRAHA